MERKIKSYLDEIGAAANTYDATAVETAAARLVQHIKENIATNPKGFERQLKQAVSTFDRQGVEQLCDQLVDHLRSRAQPYPKEESAEILAALRRKRYFDLMLKVGDVLIQTGQNETKIRRLYAQALIDLGHVAAGYYVLQVLEQDCLQKEDTKELAEARGLMGRARKQMYMDGAVHNRPGAKLRERLKDAVVDYADVFKHEQTNIWHGINTVALVERARRDKVPLAKDLPDAISSAKAILQQIAAKKTTDLWDYAIAGEASLALKDYAQALQWILKYTQDNEHADAFEYASTLRQFEEVWKLDEGDKEQASILHLLRAALLKQEGGQVQIQNPAQELVTASILAADTQFEQILGKDRYKTFQWYKMGLDRAAGVAQVRDRSGNGFGTGFLIRGADLHPSLTDKSVVVTNAHVISDDPAEQTGSPSALPADECRIRFEGLDPDKEYEVDSIIFSSSRHQLDCTIVILKTQIDNAKPYPIAKHLPVLEKNPRVYVIGHPRGGGLAYSIDDNLLLDHEKPKVHYRAPTEGGSSGSPVFNQQWDLLALHHAGGMQMKRLNGKEGTYPANEGLYIQSILNAVAEKLD